jgi:RNA polymerase sigma-70 factor (ECF subfamily)
LPDRLYGAIHNCGRNGWKRFVGDVNKRPCAAFMVVEDDEKEPQVTVTAAFTAIPIEASGPMDEAIAVGLATDCRDLADLFRANHKSIFRAAFRITGNISDAEDVLQTVFMRLVSSEERRDLSPNPEGYLYRAAVNASLDIVRSRSRANSTSIDAVDADQAPRSLASSPEEEIVEMELRELFRQAVARLEGRAATVFILRYYEGYDNKRIAEILGTSSMVVGVTLHRARTRLRKEIGRYLEKHHHEA